MRSPILAATLALAASTSAYAQTDCSTLPNPVYLPGTTDIRPALAIIAPALSSTAAGPDRLTIVYRSLSSCNATDYVKDDTAVGGTAIYWAYGATGQPEERSCTMPAGVKAHLAASDVSWRTCYGEDPPAAVREWESYVQTFLFVAPKSSSQNAITAEEAYFLLKFGGEDGKQVPPWTNPAFVMIRSPAASTQLLLGLAAGVPGTRWSANLTNSNAGSGDVVNKVKAENTSGNAEATIGILSAQRYDRERDNVKALAFKSFDQCLGAFYPDSTSTSFDKKNVRDGHYSVWGFLRFVARVGAGGEPDPRTKRLIEILNGEAQVANVDALNAAIRAGAVPRCAMGVTRPFDGARLERYESPAPCTCAFEAGVPGGSTSCTRCTTDAPCGAGRCRHGYCEER